MKKEDLNKLYSSAAKAVGIEIEWVERFYWPMLSESLPYYISWQPFIDDVQSLDLLFRLQKKGSVNINVEDGNVTLEIPNLNISIVVDKDKAEAQQSLRTAILLAAEEIGKVEN